MAYACDNHYRKQFLPGDARTFSAHTALTVLCSEEMKLLIWKLDSRENLLAELCSLAPFASVPVHVM